MSEPVRILNIVGAMYPGGMENFVMNLYRHIDRERYQFDFALNARKDNDYTEEIQAMGGRIFYLPRLNSHPFRNLHELSTLVRTNHYPVVMRHTANALIAPQLAAARRAGAITICHAHSETDSNKLLHYCGRLILHRAADIRLACSENAGRWMYGSDDCRIIRNAIDIRHFAYDPHRADHLREEFRIAPQQHVYGNIANFFIAKNHTYLIRIYREIVNRDPDAVCFCIGDGELRPQIEEEIQQLQLQDHVILTGLRKDAADFMSLLDVMLFPSIYEGLPLTLIEAQAAALPMIISDTITKKAIVTKDLAVSMNISEDPAMWAEKAIAIARTQHAAAEASRISSDETAYDSGTPSANPQAAGRTPAANDTAGSFRACPYEEIASAGYDIDQLASWYENFFDTLLKKS